MPTVFVVGLALALIGFTLPMALILSERLFRARVTIGVFNAITAFLVTAWSDIYFGVAIGIGVSLVTTGLLYLYRMLSRR